MKPIDFFTRFNSLSYKSINVDFHLHSTWTDGKSTIQEIVDTSNKKKINAIAITGHIRKDSTYFNNYEKEIKCINGSIDISLYGGFEAKVLDFCGSIDVEKEIAERADVAIVSVHRFPLGSKLYKATEFKKEISQEIELELSVAALNKGGFNVFGHAGGMSETRFKGFPVNYYEEIIYQCVKNEIAFDLSGRYHIKKLSMLYPLLKKHNPFISVGSDSHNISPIGKWNNQLIEYLL